MSAFTCNYCGGGRYFDCKGAYPPKTKCKLINAQLHFEGDHGVWRTPKGAVAMSYVLATRRDWICECGWKPREGVLGGETFKEHQELCSKHREAATAS